VKKVKLLKFSRRRKYKLTTSWGLDVFIREEDFKKLMLGGKKAYWL